MLNFTDEAMHQARAGLERMRNFLVDLEGVKGDGPAAPAVGRLVEGAREKFSAALEDDLNISEALAALFTFIKSVNALRDKGRLNREGAGACRELVLELDDKVLGLDLRTVRVSGAAAASSDMGGKADVLESEIREKVEARQKARAAKDFRKADAIRDELLKMGVLLEDTKDGVRWKRVAPKR
jgi:cysteinyl-tRNA synthetase